MSKPDRIIRALIAIVIAILYFSNLITGAASVILMMIASIFIITAFIGFCSLYAVLKKSTNKKINNHGTA